MLYLFDLDGTLISGYMDTPDKNYNAWDVLPKRRGVLNQLTMQGHTICIVTNQGAVAFGYVSEDDADQKIQQALVKLGLFNPRYDGGPSARPVYACYSDVRGQAPWNSADDAARRKPSGRMLREAVADHYTAATDGVLMVGDRDEDKAAAEDAGVPFRWASEFFGDTSF